MPAYQQLLQQSCDVDLQEDTPVVPEPAKKKRKKMKVCQSLQQLRFITATQACTADGWWGHSRSLVQVEDAAAQALYPQIESKLYL